MAGLGWGLDTGKGVLNLDPYDTCGVSLAGTTGPRHPKDAGMTL